MNNDQWEGRLIVRFGWTAGVLVIFLLEADGLAQAPNHIHYAKSSESYDAPSPTGQVAPRLQKLGTHRFPVTTRSQQAQLFIDQGVNLAYGFNHAEAGRAFREAARLDPECAMAYWGQALVLGPNINAPMAPEDEPKAHELAQKAMALRSKASEREQAYIDALAKRYSGSEKPDRKALDLAFANAMREVRKRHPDDLDAATIFAEALMDLRPWNYWAPDGRPYPETAEAVEIIESVLKRNPNHPGAAHYYIHLVEATKSPERAEEAADRLLSLMPGAGHMVHMPSHIYIRIGRYGDASLSNELAVQADEEYITQCRAQGLYPLAYYPHNIHFLWAAATMEGRSVKAIEAARKTASKISAEDIKKLTILQTFVAVPYYALTRFGKWDEILKEPSPSNDTPFLKAIWHYARGTALAATGKFRDAGRELESLRKIAARPEVAKLSASFSSNTAGTILAVAVETLAGELAARQRQFDKALAHLEKAVRLEDALVYTEPSDWHYPVRQSLAAVLLEAGRPVEAEVVYWEDLRRNPENGWSLFGLMNSLRAQGKKEEADAIEKRFHKAWAHSDVKLK
jgi:tetratricopeptide (TPR) repeat protein